MILIKMTPLNELAITIVILSIVIIFLNKPKKGTVGPQGPNGQIGIQPTVTLEGFPGFAGKKGLQGLSGPSGTRGPLGSTGFTGPSGLTGSQGSQGLPAQSPGLVSLPIYNDEGNLLSRPADILARVSMRMYGPSLR